MVWEAVLRPPAANKPLDFPQDPAKLIRAARSGDREAFAALAEPHRRELLAHCYRMLGSLLDAEDMVQETMLRAWRKLGTFEGRASFRAWLYKIATNACLDELARAPTRSLPTELFPPAEPEAPVEPVSPDLRWLEPFPDGWLPSTPRDPAAHYDQQESIALAFLTALQALPPRQRAVLLLREVVGLRATEVAGLLESSLSAVNSALYRARGRLAEKLVDRTAPQSAADPAEQRLLERYVAAWESADIDGLVQLLAEEARFPMPPLPNWVEGREAIRRFVGRHILDGDARGRWRLVATRANASPAFAWYRRASDQSGYSAFAIQVLEVGVGQIQEITTFAFPALFTAFGLPEAVQSEAGPPGRRAPEAAT